MGLIAAVGSAVTAIATSVGVAVTATALTVGFEAIAAVGIGLSVIGAVTHDKALSYVGLGLGLVGGIGALAAGAGIIGPAAAGDLSGGTISAAAQDAASVGAGVDQGTFDTVDSLASGSAAGDVGAAAGNVGAAAGNVSAAGAVDQGAFDGAAVSGAAGTPSAAAAAPDTFAGISNSDAAGAATQGGAITAGPSTVAAPATAPINPGQALAMAPTSGTPAAGAVDVGNVPGVDQGAWEASTTGATSPSGVLGSITDFATKNPLLTYGVLQAGGSLIQGMTSTLTPAQVGALNAQAAANQAAANLTTMQTKNLEEPRSTANLAPVTGTPNTIITPPSAGINSGAPPVNVTGAPTT